ncbi:MAG: glycosyltransferase family 39 protein [Candidatus Nealsonbacteria bacterium]|nr:glycosyltransferase family 39 protein [Candidatus Nealsonbacteria bacterium]
MKTRKFLILAIIFALLNMGAVFGIFGPQKYGDTGENIALINWLQGEGGQAEMARILRPLGPFLALPFEFLGEGAGLVVQNIFFYLLCAFLVFKIVEIIYHDKKQAFFASLFFVTATPVIESGLAYLTDTGAWFFYLFSIFLTLLYFKRREDWLITVNALISGLAVLIKENGGLGILFFGLMIFLSKEFSAKEKIKKLIYFGTLFLIPTIVIQVFVYHYFNYTSLDWYLRNPPGSRGESIFLSLLRYFGQLFRILGILWIFIFMGITKEWRERNWERIKIYLALLPASFSFFVWSTTGSARAVFIFAPLGILLASHGFKKIKPWAMVLVISAVIVLNYFFVSVNQKILFVDIIYNFLLNR